MKSNFLLPNSYKKWGWYIFLPALLLGVLQLFLNDNSFEWMVNLPVLYNSGFFFSREETGFLVSTNVNIFSNTVGILIIVGGLLIGFSKEKQEDEYLQSLRLKAVFTSLGISYFIILILFVTVFGVMFFNFMIIAMYLPLVIYVFYWTYLLKNDK